MEKKFGNPDWENYIPIPVCEDRPEYFEFYKKAWKMAFDHVKHIPGMPQNPYMDESFCDTQVWIWDTCFMTFFCKYAREVFPGIETLNNFYEVLYGERRLPEVIPTEQEPGWTNRVVGEPYEIKVHIADNPPIFAWAEYENALVSGDKEYIKELLYERKFLQKHFDWVENLKESVKLDGVFLPTYLKNEGIGYKWEGGASGMDNTPRGRKGEHATESRPNNPDMLWIDAICQQALSANMISKLFALVADAENAKIWQEKFEEKKDIINKHYWDKTDGYYYDIDCNTKDFYKVMSVASYWAMTAGVASATQGYALVEQLKNDKTMGGALPFVSISRSDNDYNPDGGYWRGSVWLPTSYAALIGLKNYGYFDLAHECGLKLVEHMYRTYAEFEPHTIWECYNPEKPLPALGEVEKGAHLVRPDFCGWSALGPISVYIEYVLGFHTIDAFTKTVEWAKPDTFKGEFGIKKLRFGKIETDILAKGNVCRVKSNGDYTLKINGTAYEIKSGENEIVL